MFYQCLLQTAGGSRGSKGKPSKAGKNSVQNNPEFRKILDKVELIMNDTKQSPVHQHPKLEKVRDLVSRGLICSVVEAIAADSTSVSLFNI